MKRAFTLIEILVAMTILVIVIASTLAIFRASADSWRRGELRALRYQQARFILERMSKEIASIVPSSLAGPYCLGSADRFYFISSLADAPASLVELGYWLDGGTDQLLRSFESSPDYDFNTFEKEEVLSKNVSALNFQYFTQDSWQQDWDSRPAAGQSGLLPKAVKISFDIRDEKGATTKSFSTVINLAASK